MSTQVVVRIVGTHEVHIDNDLVHLLQHGDYTLDDAIKTHAEIEAVLIKLGRAFILVDQSRAGITFPEVRKFIGDWNKKHKASGAAMYGGSLASRAAATLVLSVIRLFRPDTLPTVFMQSEAEARNWINTQREKLPKKRA
jgi:hypothetical protein